MRRRITAVALVVFAGLGAACSSGKSSTPIATVPSGSPTKMTDANAVPVTNATSATAETTAATIEITTATIAETSASTPTVESRDCAIPTTTTPTQAEDVGNNRDWNVTSFDGAVIRAHWFPLATAGADEPAPTVLMGPGWGSAGDVNVDSPGLLGALSIKTLRDAGYNVLTWDPRGFGESTGTVEIDSVDFEARDVQQLLDWLATQPEAALDAQGDPRSGMVGASYGGAIQFVTAAIDCRVDAIVPIIAWHSLQTSLAKANTPKIGWANLLAAVASGADLDPIITAASATANASGTFSPGSIAWFTDRGPGDLISDISVPTLIIQGTVDTLFTLDEGVSNYQLLETAGVPTAMLWFCGGHGVCLTDPGDTKRVGAAAVGWLDRYVKEDLSVTLGQPFEFLDQNGVAYSAQGFPQPDGDPIIASGSGTLDLVAGGGAGPAVASANVDVVGGAALPITPGPATNAVNVTIAALAKPALVVGAPSLQMTYSGTVADGERPTRVFAQLVDETNGVVLGNQITPIEVILDGQEHSTEVLLEMVAHSVEPGTTITLQIVATTVAYAQPRLGGSVEFSAVEISLPVVTSAVRLSNL